MKKILLLTLLGLFNADSGFAQQSKSFYDFKMKTLDGKEFDFAQLKGKKVLIVNTASECGNTPQYAELEVLYKTYGGNEFIILGFPANNFGSQEPGSDQEIAQFCSKNYAVSFPMFSKISVKGNDKAELYQWLTQKVMNGVEDKEVTWNFQKFMIDENGKYVGSISPRTSPKDEKLVNWIKQ